MRFSLIALVAAAATAFASPTGPRPIWAKAIALRDEPHSLSKRSSSVDFSLDHQILDQTLFHGKVSSGPAAIDLDVKCIDCTTTGTVTMTLTNPQLIKPQLRFDFRGVTARANVGVTANGIITYTITLFQTQSPVGVGIDKINVGVLFFVDLVFIISDSLTFEGGFEVTLPDTASFEVDLNNNGDIINSSFDGTITQSLPISVTKGDTTFKADLRLRVQAGVEAQLSLPFGASVPLGAGAIMALYANIAEFQAQLVSSEDCQLEVHEFFDINVGAFASAGVNLDFIAISQVPAVSTTFFTSPTATQCLDAILPIITDVQELIPEIPALPELAPEPTAEPTAEPAPELAPELAPEPAPAPEDAPAPIAEDIPAPTEDFLPVIPEPTPAPVVVRAAAVLPTGSPEVYTLMKCNAQIPNCPPSLQEKVVVTASPE